MSLKTLIREGWEAEGRVLFADDAPMPTREALMKAAKRAWMAAARRAGMTISDIAKACNTSRRAVRDTQKLLGCYEPPTPREPGRLKHVPDIGQRSDAEIARREDCPYHAVRAERMRRGLPRWRRSQS